MQALTSSAMHVDLSLATPFPGILWMVGEMEWGCSEERNNSSVRKGVAEDDASAMKIRRVSTDYTRRASRVVLSCQLPWNVCRKFRRV